MPVANSISVANGSTSVTATLDNPFVAAEGDLLYARGVVVPIAAVTGFATLTLALPWAGTSLVEATDWRILSFGEYWRSTITVNQQITDLIKRIDGGLPLGLPASGPIAGRAAYNSQPEGFLYLSTDEGVFKLYVRQTATAGVWSAGQAVQATPASSTAQAEAARDDAEAAATAAAGSATTASTAAANASNSATAAAGSATTASTQATNAANSATAAAGSATTASTAATNAGNSATAAAGSATTASTQATNAANSATAAAGSATTATTQATNAGNSATTASTAATNANNSFIAFDKRFLGPKASNPTLDNQGAALITGAMYWNTTANEMRAWNGTSWVVTYSPSTGSVASFNGRTGPVVPVANDYAVADINGLSTALAARAQLSGAQMTGALDWAAIVSVASAATVDLGAQNSNRVLVTGTTPITSFGTATNRMRQVRFAGILTLTHNATSLFLPGGNNLTTAPDDTLLAVSDGSGNWRVIAYYRSNGKPTVPSTPAEIGAASLSVEDQVLAGGARVTVKDLGSVSTGTITPDPGDRPMQRYSNAGAHTLAPGTNPGSYLLDIINATGAGAITTSGFTRVTGDSFTTTVGHKFRCGVSVSSDGSLLQVQAMQ